VRDLNLCLLILVATPRRGPRLGVVIWARPEDRERLTPKPEVEPAKPRESTSRRASAPAMPAGASRWNAGAPWIQDCFFLASWVAQHDPPRLALYSLTESARTPFHAEPTHSELGQTVKAHFSLNGEIDEILLQRAKEKLPEARPRDITGNGNVELECSLTAYGGCL